MDHELADVQQVLVQKRAERQRAEEERRRLVQRSSRDAKMRTQLKLASKRAEKVKTIDICFVLDITASMQHWLERVHEKIAEIIEDNLESLGPLGRVRVAFVGFRDYGDEEHPVVHAFTSDVGQVKNQLRQLRARGGGDQCEDVVTGLEEAAKLDWSSTAKVLYLLSQTPHHGWRFHTDFKLSCDKASLQDADLETKFYDLHGEDPRQWAPMDQVLQD